MKEIWKDIPNYEGYYAVSNFGQVKSVERTIKNSGNLGQNKFSKYKERILKKGKRKRDTLELFLPKIASQSLFLFIALWRLRSFQILKNCHL